MLFDKDFQGLLCRLMEQFVKNSKCISSNAPNSIALKNTVFWIANKRLVNWELKIGALFSFVIATRSDQISAEKSLKASGVKLEVKLKGFYTA